MNVDDLEVFYWAATLKSFGSAAERLGVTQPAVSQRIQILEQALGTRLFCRKPFGLTAAGRRARQDVKPLLSAAQSFRAKVHPDSQSRVLLRIGVIQAVLHASFGSWVAGLREREPGLVLEVTLHTSAQLERALELGLLDMAVTTGPVSGTDVETQCLTHMPMAFLGGSKSHTRPRYTFDELASHGLITFQSGSQPYRNLMRRLATSPHIRVHTASSVLGILELVGAGLGVAALPRVVAEQAASETEKFRVLTCEEELPSLPIHVSYRTDPVEVRHRNLILCGVDDLARLLSDVPK